VAASRKYNEEIKLPEGTDENEWLASHSTLLYNKPFSYWPTDFVLVLHHFNMILTCYQGTIEDVCTTQTCPEMNAGRYRMLLRLDITVC